MPDISIAWFMYITVPIGFIMLMVIIFQGGRPKRVVPKLETKELEFAMDIIHTGSYPVLEFQPAIIGIRVTFRLSRQVQLQRLELRVEHETFDPMERPKLKKHLMDLTTPTITKFPILVRNEGVYWVWFEIRKEIANERPLGRLWALAFDREWFSCEFIIPPQEAIPKR